MKCVMCRTSNSLYDFCEAHKKYKGLLRHEMQKHHTTHNIVLSEALQVMARTRFVDPASLDVSQKGTYSGPVYEAVKNDIEMRGVLKPVECDGKIVLDGGCRVQACRELLMKVPVI